MTQATPVGLDELRLRASLLSHYELSWLGAGDEGEPLFADSTRVLVGNTRHWTLDDAVRRSVASRVPFEELRRAWQRLPHRPADDRQRAIDRIVGERAPVRTGELNLTELRAMAWLSRWLGDHLPMTEEINRAVALADLFEPLRGLADGAFVGRWELLVRLHAHLTKPGPPLVVHGVGGIGKSALLAQHVLRSAPTALVCYLNFDQTALDPAVPATVIGAAAQQLAMQVTSDQIDYLLASVRDQLRGGDKHYQTSSRSSNVGTTHTDLLRLLEFTIGDEPMLLVLDTFEEVQRRGAEIQESFADLLREMSRQLPNLSIVVAGRSPATNLGFDSIEVPLLTTDDAIELLRSLVLISGELSMAEARHVVDAVRRTPLCIRLAAGILRKHPRHDAFRDIAVRLGAVEGELYHRLLGYIENPEVRRLAHPGLTLRRVTPQLIQQVLALPCRVAVPDQTTANLLFAELAREAMLVDQTPDRHELVHRKDVRQMMLPRVAADDPSTVAKIHRRAIAYYEHRTDTVDRTEELYHRLMLGHKRATLERRWDDTALAGLIPSLDELPPTAKAYLATKSQYLGVSDEDLLAADLTDRRELVLRRVRKLFQERMFDRALVELDEHRSEFGDVSCEITDLRVQVLDSLGQYDRALAEAEAGRERAATSGSPQDFYTLTFHLIRLHELRAHLRAAQEEAVKALPTTDAAPPTTGFHLVRLQLIVHCLRLTRRGAEPSPFTSDELAAEAVRLYHNLSTRAVRGVPGLLRDIAGEVGERAPKILRAALRSYGLDARDIQAILGAFDDVPAPLMDIRMGAADRYPFADRLADLIDTSPVPTTVLDVLAEIYRQDADDAVSGTADIEFVLPSRRREAPLDELGNLGSSATSDMKMVAEARAQANEAANQGHYQVAIRLLTQAAEQASDDDARAMAFVSLAYVEAETAGLDTGIRRIRRARELTTNSLIAAKAESQHALLLLRAGRLAQALERYDTALRQLFSLTDVSPSDVAPVMLNRGLTRLAVGDIEGAGRDLAATAALAEEHDLPVLQGKALANLGDAARLTGELPTALTRYEQAARVLGETRPYLLPRIQLDMAETRLAAGLANEAVVEIHGQLPTLRQTRVGFDVAVAEHRLAVAEFLRGAFEQAAVYAAAAGRRFTRRGLDRWSLLATLCRLRVQVAITIVDDRPPQRATQERAAELASRLTAAGMPDEAAVAYLLAARIAILRRARDEADKLINAAPRLSRRTPVDCRMLLRLCRAELALSRNNPAAALAQARRGFTDLIGNTDRLGTLDLPTGTAVHGQALATLALGIAHEQGDTKMLFDWLERVKAPVYHYDPRPADESLVQQRTISRLRQQFLLEGRPVAELNRRFSQLQPSIRRPVPSSWLGSRTAVTEQLGHRVLVSLGKSHRELFAVVLNGRTTIVPLGHAAEVYEVASQLHADLSALAPNDLTPPLRDAVHASATHRAAWLDQLVIQPLLPFIGDRELVISPTGPLRSTAWGALPSLRGHVVSVTPSASHWLRAEQATPGPVSAAVMISSSLQESSLLAPKHLQRIIEHLTVAQAMSAIDGAALAHFVTHVKSDLDNPWFSGARLSDGHLHVYEVASLAQPPELVVLTGGDLGYAGALLEAGVRSIIIVPVRIGDTVLAGASTDFYRLILDGSSVAEAVAELTAADPLKRPFVCVGASLFPQIRDFERTSQ